MLVPLAGILAFASVGFLAYGEWKESTDASAAGFFIATFVMLIMAWSIISAMFNGRVEDNDEGLTILALAGIALLFAFAFLGVAIHKLQ